MEELVILIIYRNDDSSEVESIEVTSDRDGATERLKECIGRATITNYRLGDTYVLA